MITAWLLLLLLQGTSVPGTGETPPQAARGQKLFFEPPVAEARCASCHSLDEKGVRAGPDLKRLARLHPRAIRIAIVATRTMYVREVGLKNEKSIPAMILSNDSNALELYDLSMTPPVLRQIPRSHVSTIKDNVMWKHPPSTTQYGSEELADIIAYIRWEAYGDTKGVDPHSVE